MKTLPALAALLLAATAAHAQQAPHEINVTSDSPSGWMPSADQERDVSAASTAWFAALESGDFAGAYAMLAPNNRAEPYEEFASRNAAYRDMAGAARGVTVLKVTWTKDPADAPFPGTYAAVDFATRHVNVDRECGYQMWYQKPEGGPFVLMRIQTARFDNATAAEVEKAKGREEVDRLWAEASASCPNYRVTD